jgi:hypothetical protein
MEKWSDKRLQRCTLYSGDTGDADNTKVIRGTPWLEEGNIILQAENTRFRVLQSLLSSNSPVFQDMFAIPQPCHQELIDGCPLVFLQDPPEDLTILLNGMFPYACVLEGQPERTPEADKA